MATVTVRGVTTANTGTINATSLAITLPTCSAGDLLHVYLANNLSTASPSTPSGWTLQDSNNVRTDNYGYLFTKTASSSDSGVIVTFAFGAATASAAVAIASLATADAEAKASKSTDGTTLTLPAITPVADDCIEVGFISNCWRAGTDTSGISAPSGWTERADTTSSLTSGNNIEVGLYTIQLVGQAGTAQATADANVPGNSHSGLMFAVTSAPAATPLAVVGTVTGGMAEIGPYIGTGGTEPYTYSISPSGPTEIGDGYWLVAEDPDRTLTYTVTVTDASSATAATTATVEPSSGAPGTLQYFDGTAVITM